MAKLDFEDFNPFSSNSPYNPANGFHDIFMGGGEDDKNLNDLLADEENKKRKKILADALGDPTLDDQSLAEIKSISGAAAGTAAQAQTLLDAARAGKGIYAVRKIDAAQRRLVADMPGRRQLSPTYGR